MSLSQENEMKTYITNTFMLKTRKDQTRLYSALVPHGAEIKRSHAAHLLRVWRRRNVRIVKYEE